MANYLIGAPDESVAAWKRHAQDLGVPLAAWIRLHLDQAAGLEPEPLQPRQQRDSEAVFRDVDYLRPHIARELASSRAAGEGHGSYGFLPVTALAKRIGAARWRVMACIEQAPDAFRFLDAAELHAIGSKHNARLVGMAEWGSLA